MSLSMSKCLHSNNCLQFLKRVVPLMNDCNKLECFFKAVPFSPPPFNTLFDLRGCSPRLLDLRPLDRVQRLDGRQRRAQPQRLVDRPRFSFNVVTLFCVVTLFDFVTLVNFVTLFCVGTLLSVAVFSDRRVGLGVAVSSGFGGVGGATAVNLDLVSSSRLV
jgi:hypothetical protein